MKSLEIEKIIIYKSKILPFNQFLDDKKVIRVGERLANAEISVNSIYSIIL